MNLRNIIIGIVLVVILAVGAGIGYLYIAGGDGEVSQDISNVSEGIEAEAEAVVFSIVSEESEASFSLEEDLRGSRITVVGTTNQVGGDFAIDFANPSASEVGTITINARSLETDNNFRNQAMRSDILQSAQDEYEFITFAPTSLSGLPDSVEIGETYTFDIIGDLTIIDTTTEVTFNAEVTIVSETEITGSATTNILYGEWGLPVPSAPIIANVSEEADLAINFVASSVVAEATQEADSE